MHNTFKTVLLTSLFAMLLPVTHQAIAAAASPSCSVTSYEVNFGIYDVFNPVPTDSSGTIRVNCTPANTSYTVLLDNGNNGTIKTENCAAGETATTP